MLPERQTTSGPARGRFVVVEGLDGAGTTTVAGALAEALKGRGLRVRLTAEPTDGAFGELLRRHLRGETTLDPTATAMVFSADRADHLATTVRPSLERGRWVVSDRYLLSTLAYQGAEGVDREAMLAASRHFDVPDLTVVLEVPDSVREQRMASRDATERYEDPALAPGLRAAYEASIELLRAHGHRIDTVDATPGVRDIVADVCARLDSGD